MSQSPSTSRVALPHCPVCGASDRAPWLRSFGFELVRCTHCGHRYASSVLSSEVLSGEYYAESDDAIRSRTLAAKQERLAEYLALFPELFGAPGRVLDVGCNAGELLRLFKGRGWTVAGVERCVPVARFAREQLDAPVWDCAIEDLPPDAGPFDLVTLVHVLEHVTDPRAVLLRLAALVADRGSLLIEVPNADDLLVRVFRGFYRPLAPGDHLSFFDQKVLGRLLAAAGWTVRRFATRTHARDVFYASALSMLDFAKTRGGRRLESASGVTTQTRYRGRWRVPLKTALDQLTGAVDPLVALLQQRVAPQRGSALLVWATKGG